MAARTGNGQVIQQGEVVEAEHFDQLARRALGIHHGQPAVELDLGLACGLLDAVDAVLHQRGVVALGNESDLVLQVSQTVVDGCGRQHQHARLDAFLDDLAHQAVVSRLGALAWGFLVAEVVALVDDHEVVIAPVHMRQVNVARRASITGQVGMVQHVVVEPVSRQHVALVVGLVERPVVAQPLRGQHQNPVVAQLGVLDDGQRLEGLAQPDAVRDDAAAKAGKLVDGADDTVTLELEQLLPNDGVADARGRLDDALLVHLVVTVPEEMVQDRGVDGEWGVVSADAAQRLHQGVAAFMLGVQCIPLLVEPLGELRRLGGRFRRLNKVHGIARRQAQPIGAKGERTQHHLFGDTLCATHHGRALRYAALRTPQVNFSCQPLGALVRQPPSLKLVPVGPVARPAQKVKRFIDGGQDELHPVQLGHGFAQLSKGKQRKRGGDTAELAARLEVRSHQVYDAVCAAVLYESHVFLPFAFCPPLDVSLDAVTSICSAIHLSMSARLNRQFAPT